jgi:hypothetical protein
MKALAAVCRVQEVNMQLMTYFFIGLILSPLCQAIPGGPILIRATFPSSAVSELPAPPLFQRVVTPQEIEDWKKGLVYELYDQSVRSVLENPQEAQSLPSVDGSAESMPSFLVRLSDFARNRGRTVELGLLDSISLATLKKDNKISGPFSVEYSIPRDEFKSALKEILYSAGYVDGLEQLFVAVAKAKAQPGVKIGSGGVIKKTVEIKVAVGTFRQASKFLEKGTVESLEKQEWMETVAPKVEKYLEEDLEAWAKLFCVVTKSY